MQIQGLERGCIKLSWNLLPRTTFAFCEGKNATPSVSILYTDLREICTDKNSFPLSIWLSLVVVEELISEAGCWIFITVRKNSKVLPVASGQPANDQHSFLKWAKPSGQSSKWPVWGRTKQNLSTPPLQWMDLGERWLTVGWMGAFIQIHPLKINMLLLTQTYSIWKILSSIFVNIVNRREGGGFFLQASLGPTAVVNDRKCQWQKIPTYLLTK